MNAIWGRVSESGRLSLPAELRRSVGLESGGDVVIEATGKEIRIRTLAQVIADAQALSRELLRGHPEASVDDFLAERRRDAERE